MLDPFYITMSIDVRMCIRNNNNINNNIKDNNNIKSFDCFNFDMEQ